jgi:type IV pilus assembly protein PilQ
MHDTDIPVVLRALARAVGQNIIINNNVKGTISINIDQSPWDKAFLSILHSSGLTHRWQDDIITIISTEDRSQGLRQLEIEERIQSKRKELERVELLHTKVVPINFADPNSLKENLEKFLTEKENGQPLGSVMVNQHTNSLIIQAIRNDIDRILPLIAELDRPIPQILIEAHIIEATSLTARELGIQWGGLYHGAENGNNYWITPGYAQGSDGIGSGTDAKIGATGTIDPSSAFAANFPATLTDSAGFSLGYVAESVGRSILAVQLSALQKDGKLNILSSPSITTLDNQQAIIESGKEVPFQTVEDGEVKISFKKAVLSLKVIPHVIDKKTLKLAISTHKDELDFANQVQGHPTIITKNAQTSVILFDGQTTVIGGLNKETSSYSESGVPWLKDIPFLGHLFRSKNNQKDMEEVLIFITPHILGERPADQPVLSKDK